MASLKSIAAHLGKYLNIDEVPDYGGALNGVQLENDGEVRRIVAAVDACLPVVKRAASEPSTLLVVHHGMFWQGAQRIQGPYYDKLKAAMDANLAVYSVHIPLDVHPQVGNNALLGKAIGLKAPEPFFPWKGILLGFKYATALKRDALVKKVGKALGGGPVHLCPGGPKTVKSVGIITGGAGSEIFQAASEGVDTFITGEGPHWSYTAAEELGINVIYGGHYATETFGVKALAAHLAKRYDLPWDFIDHPTGL